MRAREVPWRRELLGSSGRGPTERRAAGGCLPPTYTLSVMKLPKEIRELFVHYGRQGGKARARRVNAAGRRAIAQRAAASRWIRERFGASSFAAVGLPGGDVVDTGLAHLANGTVSAESLAVSLAAPRLRREGVPVPLGCVQTEAEDRLYELLSARAGGLAHARYNAYLEQIVSFADACCLARRPKPGAK